jgi:hypothetical protein
MKRFKKKTKSREISAKVGNEVEGIDFICKRRDVEK